MGWGGTCWSFLLAFSLGFFFFFPVFIILFLNGGPHFLPAPGRAQIKNLLYIFFCKKHFYFSDRLCSKGWFGTQGYLGERGLGEFKKGGGYDAFLSWGGNSF